jgi:bifunctional non-homologous end joining protein LigD
VEDHPLDYGDFEGTIPEGPVWRRHGAAVGSRLPGTPDDPHERGFKKRRPEVHPGMASGCEGSWVLVRMKWDRFGGKRTNWLLIKHRDAYAVA